MSGFSVRDEICILRAVRETMAPGTTLEGLASNLHSVVQQLDGRLDGDLSVERVRMFLATIYRIPQAAKPVEQAEERETMSREETGGKLSTEGTLATVESEAETKTDTDTTGRVRRGSRPGKATPAPTKTKAVGKQTAESKSADSSPAKRPRRPARR